MANIKYLETPVPVSLRLDLKTYNHFVMVATKKGTSINKEINLALRKVAK